MYNLTRYLGFFRAEIITNSLKNSLFSYHVFELLQLDVKMLWSILIIRGNPYQKKLKIIFHPNMKTYTPTESPCRFDKKSVVFTVNLWAFRKLGR
jgi:hypothetical protein